MKSQNYFYESDCSSTDILQRISAGDKAAVGECLDKYGKLIWSLSRKFTDNREDAEDAVQEIFIDVWRFAARFDAAKSPEGAFITLIARRRLIDRLRRSGTQPQTFFFESALLNQASDAHKKMQIAVEVKSVVQALEKLSAREKQILQMSIFGGMTHSEIAKTVNLPLGTVKSQIRRSFQKIRISIGLPLPSVSGG